MSYETMTPSEFAERRERGERLRLVDVREQGEFELASVEGAELLPMSRFFQWVDSLEREEEIVVMCHHGVRSAMVCMALARAGFKRLHNLAGGIDRWSEEVDPMVPKY